MPTDEEFLAYNQGIIREFRENQGVVAQPPFPPAWFHNLRANPSVTVELGRGSYQAQALIAHGADRDRLYGLIAAKVPLFGEYEKLAVRTFPVVVLEGVPAPA